MCDERTAFDNDAYLSAKELTRRQFGAGSAGAGTLPARVSCWLVLVRNVLE